MKDISFKHFSALPGIKDMPINEQLRKFETLQLQNLFSGMAMNSGNPFNVFSKNEVFLVVFENLQNEYSYFVVNSLTSEMSSVTVFENYESIDNIVPIDKEGFLVIYNTIDGKKRILNIDNSGNIAHSILADSIFSTNYSAGYFTLTYSIGSESFVSIIIKNLLFTAEANATDYFDEIYYSRNLQFVIMKLSGQDNSKKVYIIRNLSSIELFRSYQRDTFDYGYTVAKVDNIFVEDQYTIDGKIMFSKIYNRNLELISIKDLTSIDSYSDYRRIDNFGNVIYIFSDDSQFKRLLIYNYASKTFGEIELLGSYNNSDTSSLVTLNSFQSTVETLKDGLLFLYKNNDNTGKCIAIFGGNYNIYSFNNIKEIFRIEKEGDNILILFKDENDIFHISKVTRNSFTTSSSGIVIDNGYIDDATFNEKLYIDIYYYDGRISTLYQILDGVLIEKIVGTENSFSMNDSNGIFYVENDNGTYFLLADGSFEYFNASILESSISLSNSPMIRDPRAALIVRSNIDQSEKVIIYNNFTIHAIIDLLNFNDLESTRIYAHKDKISLYYFNTEVNSTVLLEYSNRGELLSEILLSETSMRISYGFISAIYSYNSDDVMYLNGEEIFSNYANLYNITTNDYVIWND